MALVTADQNVKFDGTLEDVVVLSVDGDNKTVIRWEQLSVMDQALLTSMVDDFGGDAPLAAPSAGHAVVNFGGAAVGTDATGLDNVATATAGKATVDLGSAKAGTDLSGLIVVAGSTAGSQTVTINPVFANGAAATGLAADVPATAGTDSVTFTGTIPATTALVAGTYDFDVTIDGGAVQTLAVTTAGGETYAAIAALMSAQVVGGTVTFNTDTFTVTSNTTGALSSAALAAGTLGSLGSDLFAALALADTVVAVFNGAVVGTIGAVTTYTASIVVDGVTKNISITGGSAQTVTTLLSQINTDLGAAATASLVGGSIKVTSATVGSTSTVAITDGSLFAALTGTATIATAVAGTDGEGGSTTWRAIVEVDGIAYNVAFTGTAGDTVADVITEIDADLGAAASVALTGGDIVITSGTTGKASRVRVFDTGGLFSHLTGYTAISYVDGVEPRVYTATVVVDGVAIPVSVQGSNAQTMAELETEIDTAVFGAGSAYLVDGNIKIVSGTDGVTSTVAVIDGDLFRSVAGFKGGVKVVNGAADLAAAFATMRMPNGTSVMEYFPVVTVGLKPADNTPYTPPKRVEFSYFGGAPAAWRYMNDDTVINP